MEHEFRPEMTRPDRNRIDTAGEDGGGQLERKGGAEPASPRFIEKAVEHLSAIFADTLASTADSLATSADQLAGGKFKPVAGISVSHY